MTSPAESREGLTNQVQEEKNSDNIEDHVVSIEKFVKKIDEQWDKA